MINEIIALLTPAYVAGAAIAAGLLIQIIIRLYYTYKFKKAGGIHAPKLAHNPITGMFPTFRTAYTNG
jgi:hypothetical protein